MLGVGVKPGLGGAANAPLLLGANHLERIAVAVAALLLHLAEDQPPTAPDDEVELVATRPLVPAEDPVAAHEVVREGTALAAVHAAAAVSA